MYNDGTGSDGGRGRVGRWKKSLGSVQTLSEEVLQTRRNTDPRQGIGVVGTRDLNLASLRQGNARIRSIRERAHVQGTPRTTDRP